jgi:hypothetical protein
MMKNIQGKKKKKQKGGEIFLSSPVVDAGKEQSKEIEQTGDQTISDESR